MATDMEASMFSMFSMFNMCVHAYVHVCACMYAWDTPPHTHTHPHPIHSSATLLGDPWNQLKFNNTWTNQDISIPFEDLKSVKILYPWVGVWFGGWVGGWLGGLMGGVRSKH